MSPFLRATVMTSIARTALASTLCAQEQVSLKEDFSAYAAGSDASPAWEAVNGQWTVQEGAYLQSQFRKEETYSFLRSPVVSDITLSARFRIARDGAGVKAAGLAFRSQASLKCYFAHFDSKNSQLLLYLQSGEEYKELARIGGVPIAAEQWHVGRIVCKGPSISVYLDDRLLCERRDSTYLAGRVGLRTGQELWRTDAYNLGNGRNELIACNGSLYVTREESGGDAFSTYSIVALEHDGGGPR
jgi:hypothetical protein